VLDVLERDGMDAVARAKGDLLHAGLLALGERHPVVGDVRGRGLLQGLELVADGSDRLGAEVTRRCLELGLHMNVVQLPGMGGTFRIAPPLTSTDAELEQGVAILDRALGEVSAARAA